MNYKTNKLIKPTHSWKNLQTHHMSAINDPWYKILLNLQNNISIFTMQFYELENMRTMYLPITTGSISSPMGLGSDSSPVDVTISGKKIFLADSMQFMLEYGCRLYDKGCYYIMPSFRGEDADARHLCQFYHSEAEIPGTLEDVINLVERYIKYLCVNLKQASGNDILSSVGNLTHIDDMICRCGNIERIKFKDAFELLKKESSDFVSENNLGIRTITSFGEKRLMEMFDGIVWLTHFDRSAVPFYQAYDLSDERASLSADLLFGVGETVGSGERHANASEVLLSLKDHCVDVNSYKWYYDMKKQYPMKTSGFGMGIERFLMWLLDGDDIRDFQILPRFNGVDIIA